ncbi:MAG: 50S ribosomal protein L11 [Chloroflexi bacterium]|nr:50S ribosomal protein L11 [Chloroflexota bacterium]
MAKKVRTVIQLKIPAGQATPAPPVGPALGQHGVNIMQFVKEYNERTASMSGSIVPVSILVYTDRSFTFETKSPPASDLLRKAAGVEKGSGTAGLETIGRVNRTQIREIAEAKVKDLNAIDVEGAMKIIEGSARSMGLTVVD